MRSKDVLKKAIKEFDGTVIVVSHDRDFLNGLVEKVYEFGNQQVIEHLGGIYEFLEKKKMDSLKELEVSTSPLNESDKTTDQESVNKLSYEERKELARQIKRVEKQISDIEKSIESKENKIAEIELKLTTPEGAADASLFERHGLLSKELEDDMLKWEELTVELQNISKD